jgi:hypothetical protein
MEPMIRQLVDSTEIIKLLGDLNELKIRASSEKEKLQLKFLTDQTKIMENHFGKQRYVLPQKILIFLSAPVISSDIQIAFHMMKTNDLQQAWNFLYKHYHEILNMKLPIEVPVAYYYLLGMLLERKKRYVDATTAYRIALLLLGNL